MQGDNLQDVLHQLMQSGSGANPAYTTLLDDYTRYHAVLCIEGGLFILLLIGLSIYFWRRYTNVQKAAPHSWPWEKKVYACFGLLSTVIALALLVIVLVNLSTVVNPQEGFIRSISDLGTPQAGTPKAALYQAATRWVQSGSAPMPSLLEDRVRNRLAWQRPKAIVCTLLLVVLAASITQIWRRLLYTELAAALSPMKRNMLTLLGLIAIPITLVVLLMALANTQASFAPIMLTLLFA